MDVEVTSKEAFRLGFLSRCAEEGLTGPALQERIKQAGFPIGWAVPAVAGLGGLALLTGNPGTAGAMVGLPAAVGLGTGAALGYGAAKVTEPDISSDDIKAQELADTYRVYANKARAARRAAKYRRSVN